MQRTPVYEDDPPVSELQTIWMVDGCLVRDNTSHVMRREGYPPEAVADALDLRAAFTLGIPVSTLAEALR